MSFSEDKAAIQKLLSTEASSVGFAQDALALASQGSGAASAPWYEQAGTWWRAAGKAASQIHALAQPYKESESLQLDPPLGDWNGQPLRAQQRAIGYVQLAQQAEATAVQKVPTFWLKPGLGRPTPPPTVNPSDTFRPPTPSGGPELGTAPDPSDGESSVNLAAILIAGLALLVGWKVLK